MVIYLVANSINTLTMKVKSTITMLLVLLLIVIACNKTSEEVNDPVINGNVTSYTDCKTFAHKPDSIDTVANQSCIEFNYNLTANKLTFKHINAGFNCCPWTLLCSVTLLNDTIVLEESESYASCDCSCLFDLDIEVTGIVPGQYFVKFIEPYCGDQEKLEFTIDVNQNNNGIYCVERNQYPWGIFP